jgi:hypothetical protein
VNLHPIPPGLWCVPSALVAITGADFATVIHPALNRHGHAASLTSMVVESTMRAALATLRELGYTPRCYKHGDLRAHVATWARRSAHYPGRTLLIGVPGHVMVIQDGRVYDSWTPHGELGAAHPYGKTTVTSAHLVESISTG